MEKDGSLNKKYCSMCYINGEFLTPTEIDTAEKMQKFCIQEMKKAGMNGIFAWIATRPIPRLEKWQFQLARNLAAMETQKVILFLEINQ